MIVIKLVAAKVVMLDVPLILGLGAVGTVPVGGCGATTGTVLLNQMVALVTVQGIMLPTENQAHPVMNVMRVQNARPVKMGNVWIKQTSPVIVTTVARRLALKSPVATTGIPVKVDCLAHIATKPIARTTPVVTILIMLALHLHRTLVGTVPQVRVQVFQTDAGLLVRLLWAQILGIHTNVAHLAMLQNVNHLGCGFVSVRLFGVTVGLAPLKQLQGQQVGYSYL